MEECAYSYKLDLFLAGCGQDEAEPDFCSAFSVLTEVTKEEKQVETVTTILDDISPGLSEALKFSLVDNMMAEGNDSNSSTPTLPPLQVAYNTLAQNFSVRPSVSGYNNFVEAVNEISLAQAEACNDPSFVPTIEIVQRLAEEFDNATGDSGSRDLSRARSAFGKLLCLNTRTGDSEVGARRRKRQSSCNGQGRVCSEQAKKEGLVKVKSVCEFFTCLQAMVLDRLTSRIGPVFGFELATDTEDECLAFVIDTTGSMGAAIGAAKQIILSFLASEDNANELQCYILVPFNDYDDVDPAFPGNYYI